jgi:predicted lipoprotein with Yx(FWY)xxD motif
MRKTLYTIAVAVSAVFALSACSALDLSPDDTGNNASTEDTGDAGTADEGTSVDPAPTSKAAPLVKAVQATIGSILTTGKGMALYRWDKDTPGQTTCYDTCATKFTAYPYADDLAFEGVDRKLVGKVQRTDGSYQLTINKWPVYTFVNDKVGEWKAQGQNGSWWLATPSGGKLSAK